jgi:DNA-binding transcriptional LysR family regulator
LLFPRPIGPTLYHSLIGACRKAGFDPMIGQLVPQLASVITLVAANLGVSIVPVSMSQLQITGVAYRAIAGEAAPIAPLALAHRRGDTSPIVRNFIARALA